MFIQNISSSIAYLATIDGPLRFYKNQTEDIPIEKFKNREMVHNESKIWKFLTEEEFNEIKKIDASYDNIILDIHKNGDEFAENLNSEKTNENLSNEETQILENAKEKLEEKKEKLKEITSKSKNSKKSTKR